MSNPVIVISGSSGAGKSTLARYLAKKYIATYIEGDDYFLHNLPSMALTLKSGAVHHVANRDSEAAIDWNTLNNAVESAARTRPVIVATFAPICKHYTFPVSLHIQLRHHADLNAEEPYITAARQVSKRLLTTTHRERDTATVSQAVIPFQHTIRSDAGNTPDVIVYVYHPNGERKTVEELRVELAEHLEEYLIPTVQVLPIQDRLD